MSVDREALSAAFDALDADLDRLFGFDCAGLTTPELRAWLARVERVRRRLPALEHPVINTLARQATPQELGGTLAHAIAEATLISRQEATRRIGEAADLGPRCALTGEPMPPVLAATAAGQKDGTLGAGQVAVIRSFSHQLPGWVDQATREGAEAKLAHDGTQFRPDQLARLADKLADAINPDGNYTDEDRARRRGLIMGAQGPDKMSRLSGWITPELRATLEAMWAKLAAPGMCNPLDDTPCVPWMASWQGVPSNRHQRTHLRLRRTPPTGRQRLDHPQKHPRRHRMDPTTTPAARPTPHQHLLAPRKTAAPQRRRRRRRGPQLGRGIAAHAPHWLP